MSFVYLVLIGFGLGIWFWCIAQYEKTVPICAVCGAPGTIWQGRWLCAKCAKAIYGPAGDDE
jgi:hypothetical protein